MTSTWTRRAVAAATTTALLLSVLLGEPAAADEEGTASGIYVHAPDLSAYDTVELCSDTCDSYWETRCEDGGPYNGTVYPGTACSLGTDCAACGPGVYASFSTLAEAVGNFTDADGSFQGSLFIANTALASLDGMQPVARVNGTFGVENNALLADISALGSLEEVEGLLYFQHNLLSSTLDGLGALTRVGANFEVENNTALEVMDLPGLRSVGAALYVGENPRLERLRLDGLEAIGFESPGSDYNRDYLDVYMNVALEEVSFATLAQVAGQLYVFYNYNATSIHLDELQSSGTFSLILNELGAAGPLTGYDSLQYVGQSQYDLGYFELSLNPIQSIDSAFNSLRAVQGSFSVGDNVNTYYGQGNPPLESFTNSFRRLSIVGGELLINMTSAEGFSGTLGSLETVGGCCTLLPPSLLEQLPACEGKLCGAD